MIPTQDKMHRLAVSSTSSTPAQHRQELQAFGAIKEQNSIQKPRNPSPDCAALRLHEGVQMALQG